MDNFIIQFNFSLKKKLKWNVAETGHCNLFYCKLFLTFNDESCSRSSWEFNLFQYFDDSVLMPFHCSLTQELKLEAAEVGHCNLFLLICSCSRSSWEFNLFQYFDDSVLMPFHCSLTQELKLEATEVGHCNLFLLICFEHSWINNSYVLYRN